jgi:hypothetical protein
MNIRSSNFPPSSSQEFTNLFQEMSLFCNAMNNLEHKIAIKYDPFNSDSVIFVLAVPPTAEEYIENEKKAIKNYYSFLLSIIKQNLYLKDKQKDAFTSLIQSVYDQHKNNVEILLNPEDPNNA